MRIDAGNSVAETQLDDAEAKAIGTISLRRSRPLVRVTMIDTETAQSPEEGLLNIVQSAEPPRGYENPNGTASSMAEP